MNDVTEGHVLNSSSFGAEYNLDYKPSLSSYIHGRSLALYIGLDILWCFPTYLTIEMLGSFAVGPVIDDYLSN